MSARRLVAAVLATFALSSLTITSAQADTDHGRDGDRVCGHCWVADN